MNLRTIYAMMKIGAVKKNAPVFDDYENSVIVQTSKDQ